MDRLPWNYVMCPNDELWESNLKKRNMEGRLKPAYPYDICREKAVRPAGRKDCHTEYVLR